MNFKKFWPFLALLVASVLFWLWHSARHPFEYGKRPELGKSSEGLESAVKPPSPVPVQEPPAGSAGSPPAPEAKLPQAPPLPQENLPAAETRVPSSTGPARNYAVEIKKFQTFQQAKKFLIQLQKQGQRGYITKLPKDQHPFVVCVGPFETCQEAQTAAQAVKKKYRVSPQVKAKAVLPPK